MEWAFVKNIPIFLKLYNLEVITCKFLSFFKKTLDFIQPFDSRKFKYASFYACG